MAGTRKRKHAAANDDTKKPTAPVQAGIRVFAAVSKAKSDDTGLKKRKTVHQRETTPPQPQKQAPAQTENKRKRCAETDDDESAESENIFKRFTKKQNVSTPQSKRFRNAQPPTPADTPSKDTAALFDKLRLGSDGKAISFVFGSAKLPDTPPRTPEGEKGFLPAELHDLIDLHASFLTALSIYYSHNGTSSSVDVHALLPMITKNWKKRTVTLDDLRRILAVDAENQTLSLRDFGRAGLCLTKSQPRGRATERAASFVDEVDLNAGFEEAVNAAWIEWTRASPYAAQDAAAFIDQLPLVEIVKDASVEKTTSLFVRGHQRLAELKASQAAAQREPTPTPEVQAAPKSLQNRGTTLLDRILAKQANAASIPAGPTKDQLERRSALQRIEDIARMLHLLAGGRARCSFSMQAIVQQLRQSLRNPISPEEVTRCLELMAKEITPGFVGLVQNGTVTGVVVTRGAKVELEELRRRVAAAAA